MGQMKVSVVLCTYQGGRFLAEQLQSIFAQTRRPDEIILSDDASTDDTATIAEELLGSSGIAHEIHVNEQNLGFRQNFAQAMQRAKGDILFLSDQDDVWHPEKIARMLVPFEHPETLMAFHDAALVDSALQPLAPSFWHTMTFDPVPFQKGDYRHLLVSNVVQGSASAFRRSLLQDALPIPEIAIHDEWLALFAALRGGLVPVPEVLMQYRQGEGNALGAGSVNKCDLVMRWLRHLQAKSVAARSELGRRRALLAAWLPRAGTLAPRAPFLREAAGSIRWLDRRIAAVGRGPGAVFSHAGNYCAIPGCRLACKEGLKDFIVAFVSRMTRQKIKTGRNEERDSTR